MYRPTQTYSGKKTAYLDHNILNYFIRFPEVSAFGDIFADFQVVYSDETLREIRRGDEGTEARLKVLENLGAMHLKPYTDENFEISNDAILSAADIRAEFNRVCDESVLTERINSSTQQTLQKFYGNNDLDSISQLTDQQSKEFKEVFNNLLEEMSSRQISPEQLSRSKDYITRTIAQHTESPLVS